MRSDEAVPAVEALERDSAVPLYAQLEEILRAQIAAGQWQANQRVPSENELNKLYGLSRMTARGVLTTLVNDGLLFRVPGKGTFLAPTKISAVSPAYRGVREQLEAMGYETRTTVLGVSLERPASTVRDRLRLDPNQAVYAIHRLRSVQDEPISLHHSFVPAALAPGLDAHDTGAEQLCVVLEKHYGLEMKRVEENLEASSATAAEAGLLAMRAHQPVLQLEDTIADGTGRVFEYSRIIFRGDKIRLRFDYDL
ncbi:GntR family transcriptional regulator [Pengzhenrongella sicca]|uniref:GntR family transcriptional regulator n=1 Tax=Pengzhenrongella sicca TaxID=2819238 RepID=A0A8A4ZHQ2_9MICO|nr:GntR family transcriptional regulator [Pengzhenrongella sicca]QTE30921.1 GntR family transcriptional regulator [Pengzhenrongella sicca]